MEEKSRKGRDSFCIQFSDTRAKSLSLLFSHTLCLYHTLAKRASSFRRDEMNVQLIVY